MELLIGFAILVFLGIVGALAYFIFLDPASTSKNPSLPKTATKPPVDIALLQKKAAVLEEKIKALETDKEALQKELSTSKDTEKSLLKEKSTSTFDAEQYEKFKKDFAQLKTELTSKEEMLEKEISEKRKHASELSQLTQENSAMKKRVTEAEDAYRKAQTAIEALTKELEENDRIIEEQKHIVDQHAENKTGGEWVSRAEFETIERELKEKEAMIQKFLSLKKEPQ